MHRTGDVADAVNSFIHRGIGVEVHTEFDTFRFAPLYDTQASFVAGEVFRTVEGHVLQEVCQSALLWLFEDRTYFLCDMKFNTVFGFFVVTDVIGQSVVQLAHAYLCVHGDGWHLLGEKDSHVTADDDCGQDGFLE